MFIVEEKKFSIEIKLIFYASDAIITIMSNNFINSIDWFLSEYKPKSKIIINQKTVLFKFKASEIRKLKLLNSSGNVDFRGNNILDYLRSEFTDFGQIVNEDENKSSFIFIASSLLIIIASITFIVKTKK